MGNITRRRFVGAGGAALVGALAGCTEGGDGNDTTGGETTASGDATTTSGSAGGQSGNAINVGVLLPFTGEYDWVGANVFPVAKMLTDRINRDGGIDGRKLNLVKGDTEATVDASVTAARKLINTDEVAVIIGPTSLTFTGVIDLIEENGVPVVTPTAGTTELDDTGGEYIFRTVPSDSLGGRAISKAARDEQYNTVESYSKMGLMVGQAPALQSFKEPIRSSFEEFGGTITKTLDYSTGKSSYQSEVGQMMDGDPEIIALVGSPEDSAKIMRAAFQAGYEGNWFVTQDQTNKDFLELVDPRITNGILGLVEADNPEAVDSGRLEQFTQDVTEATGSEPGIFSKNTYDAVNVATLAMAAGARAGDGVSRESIASNVPTVANPPGTTVTNYEDGASKLAAAEGTSASNQNSTSSGDDGEINYEGLVGPVDFDEDGDITSPFAIMRAKDKSWSQVATLPASEL